MEELIIEPIEDFGLIKKSHQRTLFSKIGIVGCGKDGQNIARIASANGIEVVFIELSEARIQNAYERLNTVLDQRINHWGLTLGEKKLILSKIKGSLDYIDLVGCDFVIEAIRAETSEAGMQRILKITVQLHGDKAQEKEVVVDTTVQEKNITHPTDTKLAHKIIRRCWKLADGNGVKLRRRYRKAVRQCVMAQRWRKDPRQRKTAQRALRKMKVIAGRLIRELERKLAVSSHAEQRENFALYRRVLRQKTGDKDKVYSLHEPQVYCMSKGKEHKKYEFGSKASVVMTKTHGVIVGAVAHAENLYDGDALRPALEQTRAITEQQPAKAIVDRGYRGRKEVDGTEVLLPGKPKPGQSKRESAKRRAQFRRRAAIEPVISHLKHQYRLIRCFLKGFVGDQMNLLLAAAAWNLKKWLRMAALFWLQLIRLLVANQTLPASASCP